MSGMHRLAVHARPERVAAMDPDTARVTPVALTLEPWMHLWQFDVEHKVRDATGETTVALCRGTLRGSYARELQVAVREFNRDPAAGWAYLACEATKKFHAAAARARDDERHAIRGAERTEALATILTEYTETR